MRKENRIEKIDNSRNKSDNSIIIKSNWVCILHLKQQTSHEKEIALGVEMESFDLKSFSNTATRKRPAEAPAVLVLL